MYSRFVIKLCSLSVFSTWALTRFTIRHTEILAVDDAILIIFVGSEIYVAHLKNVIHDFFNYWREACRIRSGRELVIVSPLPVLQFVDVPQLIKEKKL